MIRDSFRVSNPSGLHARTARELVELLNEFDVSVSFTNPKKKVEASGDSILELMMLAAHAGTKLDVEIKGTDDNKAHRALQNFFKMDPEKNDSTV